MKPGEPWKCGRCGEKGSRAVLAMDGRPGCHSCRNTAKFGALMQLVYREAFEDALDAFDLFNARTPFYPGNDFNKPIKGLEFTVKLRKA